MRKPKPDATPAVLAVLAVLFVAAAMPALGGVHYKAATDTDNGAGRADHVQVEGWVSSGKGRIEFVQSGNPIAKPGTYILTRDGGHTIYLVDPQDKSYAQWSIDGMVGMVGSLMNSLGPLVRIQFSDPKVEKLLEEDGGTVAGQPTRHYRYRTSYTMSIKVLGMGRPSAVVSDEDMWVATGLSDPALGLWLRAEPPRTGNPDFDGLMAANWAKPTGFPLKIATVSTRTDKAGKQAVSRHTMEVTELTTTAVPDSRFEIPAGYQEKSPLPGAQKSQ